MELSLIHLATVVEEYDGKKGHVVENVARAVDAESKLPSIFTIAIKSGTKPLGPSEAFTVSAERLMVMGNGSIKLWGNISKRSLK